MPRKRPKGFNLELKIALYKILGAFPFPLSLYRMSARTEPQEGDDKIPLNYQYQAIDRTC